MKVFWCLLLVLVFLAKGTFTAISVAPTISGDGERQEDPATEGRELKFGCSVQSDQKWVLCMFKHVLQDQYDSNNQEVHISCGASSDESSKTCVNKGSPELDSTASRIQFDISDSYCGLNIRSAEPIDTGEWECHVSDDSTKAYGKLEVFVSNQSEITITNPRDDSIIYDVADDRAEIEATCEARGGLPVPTFRWFVDDDRNEIDKFDDRDYEVSRDGDVATETIRFKPTLDELCRDYDMRDICDDLENDEDIRDINFSLICKVDQGDFYSRENDQRSASVIVEVRNSAPIGLSVSSILVLFCVMASTSWRNRHLL